MKENPVQDEVYSLAEMRKKNLHDKIFISCIDQVSPQTIVYCYLTVKN